jgi:LysR family hydrogen peroxide-inducible transcriptional activator
MKVSISELTTDAITDALMKERIDVGLLATPLGIPGLKEDPLFHERFLLYTAKNERIGRKKYILPSDIDPDRLWLLEEGHCLRSQVMNLCELRERSAHDTHLHYVSGSIASLMRIVDTQGGLTIVPELAAFDMDRNRRSRLRYFAPPVPVREISTITYRHAIKDKALEALRTEIRDAVSELKPLKRRQMNVLGITPTA